MQVHKFIVDATEASDYWRFCCSDLHYGSRNMARKRFLADLATARTVQARILINGDAFDGIDYRDKRFDASVLHPDLLGEKDLQGAVVRMAVEDLDPYADLIDVIGVGNHDEKWINYNANDPVARLIENLNVRLALRGSDHRIAHGGVGGYIRTVFRFGKTPKTAGCQHDLLYFHGAGGDGAATFGVGDFVKKSYQFKYDAVTMGHKHNRTFMDTAMLELSRHGHIICKERKCLQTGSYLESYAAPVKGRPTEYPYSESKQYSPKPLGGLFLRLRPRRYRDGHRTLNVVEQDVCTRP